MSDLPHAIQNVFSAVNHLAIAARRDDKTPLENSMALNEDAASIGKDPAKPQVIAFADLNRFKQINDQFGHPAGDAALRHAGNLIDTHFVKGCSAKAYRRSGDEFIILLAEENLLLFRNCIPSFKQCSLRFNEHVLHFSISFGYARTEADEADFLTLQDRAEQACLAAKSRGGGECVEWTSDLQKELVENLRSRCRECNTTISCDVPSSRLPPARQLQVCPVCKTPLTAEAPCTTEGAQKGIPA